MDEFSFYNQLCVLEDIAGQYTLGKPLCSTIHTAAELISSHLYRVAVIGEFKRGKSSLINALIGASVLPTDVIPLTAAITRLTYGTQRKIFVRYKDGRSEEKTLDELVNYATKYDKQREKTAQSVREIEVTYPSVLCKNHIEILDTPGLNDNEAMSEVTLSILGEVDAAIVVISATKPLSITEQNLIVDLIGQEGIRHLIFVVTFLDTLFDEEEKDRMLAFIKGRLKKELMIKAEKATENNPVLAEKARRILSEPNIFGVSSRQAMQGFINDDKSLLKESRFPQFKEKLLALLTAAQSEDIPRKVEHITNMVENAIAGWREQELHMLDEEEAEALRQQQLWQFYTQRSKEALTKAFQGMDAALTEKGLSPDSGLEHADLERKLARHFIKNLSTLTQEEATHEAIRNALQSAKRDVEKELDTLGESLNNWISQEMDAVLVQFINMRRMARLSDQELDIKLNEFRKIAFPAFLWTEDPIPSLADLRGVDAMKTVKAAIHSSLLDYGRLLNKQIAAWRAILLHQNADDRKKTEQIASIQAVLHAIKTRRDILEFHYEQHIVKIREIKQSLVSTYPLA